MRIAIVGAGISGLACGAALTVAGHDVRLFDKGRAAGGRMSTPPAGRARRSDRLRSWRAIFFTARDPAFGDVVAAWEAASICARWPAAGVDAWVGTPGMNTPVKALAARQSVAWGVRIDALSRNADGWRLAGDDGDSRYDAVIVAVPAEQAAPLLAPHDEGMAVRATAARSLPCWTVMAAFDRPLATGSDILRDAGAIGWAARNSAKPGRGGPDAWVIQASPDWSLAHLEDEGPMVARALLAELGKQFDIALPEPLLLDTHRWRFARTAAATGGADHHWNDGARLGACGDWLLAPRIESAWLSGRGLAVRIGG